MHNELKEAVLEFKIFWQVQQEAGCPPYEDSPTLAIPTPESSAPLLAAVKYICKFQRHENDHVFDKYINNLYTVWVPAGTSKVPGFQDRSDAMD